MSWATIADGWGMLMSRALLEGTLVFCIVLAVWWPLRRRAPAQLGSGLFLLVPLKLLLPFEIAVPTGVAALFPASWLHSAGDVAPSTSDTVLVAFAAPVTPSGIDTGTLLFAGYLGVVILLSTRFLYVQARAARLVHCARPLRRGELALDVEELRRRAGVRRAVRWLVSDSIESPAAGGLLRPYVLLPTGLLPKLGTRPLAWILLHELVHIRRCDVAVTLLQRFVQIVFFFHPVVWIANRIVDEQREFACDAEALSLSGVGRSECGEGFLSVVEWASGHGVSSAAALAMFDSKSVIKRRLVRIMQHPQQSKFSKLLSGAAVAAVASILLPTVKASPTVEVSTTSSMQDPDELRQLRSEIQRLEKAHAELRRKLDSIGRRDDADDADEVEAEDMKEEADAVEHVIEVDGVKFDDAHVKGFVLKPGQGGRWVSQDGKPFTVRSGPGDKKGVWVLKDGKPVGGHATSEGVFVFGNDAKGEAKTFTLGKTKPGVYYLGHKDGKAQLRRFHGDLAEDEHGRDVKLDVQGEDGKKRVIRLRPILKGDHVIIETQVEGDGQEQVQVEVLAEPETKAKAKVEATKSKTKNRIM